MKYNKKVKAYYHAMGQPVTKYPDDIEVLDAVSAVKHYEPSVVIGCWITHKYSASQHLRGGNEFGIDENFIFSKVKKYIMIGNESVHEKKPLLELPHKTFKFPWLYSRSIDPSKNVIYMWG